VAEIRKRIELLFPGQGEASVVQFGKCFAAPNVASFMGERVASIVRAHRGDHQLVANIHGDLNFRNVLLDANSNVFLIDFEYSGEGPFLKDYLKLECDLLYLHTPLQSDQSFFSALTLSDVLSRVDDLRAPLSQYVSANDLPNLALLGRTWETVCELRKRLAETLKSIPHSTGSTAALVWARLRYALHALTFFFLSPLQKKWALYDACVAARNLDARKRYAPLAPTLPLYPFSPLFFLSFCPGRIDRRGTLEQDVAALAAAGIVFTVALVTEIELLDWTQHSCSAFQVCEEEKKKKN
jgi:hypothetical protein